MKQLYLFENQIRDLPHELGSLYLLEMLGIDGNPLNPELKEEIMERGTKSLISVLRESAPSKFYCHQSYLDHTNPCSSPGP
jgi:CCR4-NOT transcription complex subunit 6